MGRPTAGTWETRLSSEAETAGGGQAAADLRGVGSQVLGATPKSQPAFCSEPRNPSHTHQGSDPASEPGLSRGKVTASVLKRVLRNVCVPTSWVPTCPGCPLLLGAHLSWVPTLVLLCPVGLQVSAAHIPNGGQLCTMGRVCSGAGPGQDHRIQGETGGGCGGPYMLFPRAHD